MQEVIFIIGLPGSGKSTLIEYYKSHPFIDYKVYDDWMACTFDKIKIKEFNSECRYKELIQNLDSYNHSIITCVNFCNNEFLHKSEYYLKLKFPNIKIDRIYFENDFKKCKSNIEYRDKQRGGYWEPNEKGEMWYYGEIYVPNGVNKGPLYKHEIKNSYELSQNYIIPEGYPVFPIMVQEE